MRKRHVFLVALLGFLVRQASLRAAPSACNSDDFLAKLKDGSTTDYVAKKEFYDRPYDCVKDEVLLLKGDESDGTTKKINGQYWFECPRNGDGTLKLDLPPDNNKIDLSKCKIHPELIVERALKVIGNTAP